MPVGLRRLVSTGLVSLCVLVGGLVLGGVPALAAAPEAPVTGEANPVSTTTATLNGELGELNPENALEVGTYAFLYRESTTTCEGGTTAPVPAGVALSKEPVSQPLNGLLPGTTYTFCLLAGNAADETALGSPVTFTTHGAGITEEQVANIEASAATLQAEIDPGGGETTYRFEYDTAPYTSSAAHGTSITREGAGKEGTIGSGTTPEPVEVRLESLQPGTVYYYRVVASNEAGTFNGPGKTFTTNPALGSEPSQHCENEQRRAEQPFGLGLPDCRAYEMVSPVQTGGQDATDASIGTGPRAAVSGEAIAYSSRGSFAGPSGANLENELVSRRDPNGWATQGITPLFDPQSLYQVSSYQALAFTPDLGEGIASTSASLPGTGAPTPSGVERDLYLADFATPTKYRYVGETFFPMGASTDLSRVVFGEKGDVSEWLDGGSTVPVSVSNAGKPLSASVGDATFVNQENSRIDKDVWHSVSGDGSRVYFTSPAFVFEGIPGERQLYVRVNIGQPQSPMSGEDCTVVVDACTVEVSASERGVVDPHGPQPARFWGASVDGSKVFFTSSAELTEDAYTGGEDNAANLYEYNLDKPEGERLADLTVDETDAEGAAVQGVAQISEDGSYAYFVAKGALKAAGGEPLRNSLGDEPVAEGYNLYVVHEGGAPVFVATLAKNDRFDWSSNEPETRPGPGFTTAVVSPGGGHLAFMSERSLTGYDNRQAQPGECERQIAETGGQQGRGNCREVYLYDAVTGGLVCASCDSSGARPVGPSGLRTVAGATFVQYRPRQLLEDGTLFFDSSDALVPHASDGRGNVYEYEDGHVYAISNVAGGHESFFMDASADGRDVFFGTADQLLPEDVSNNVVVYDARAGGGFPVVVGAPACSNADSCKPPVSAQPAVFGAPASATFSGVGNRVVPSAAGGPGSTPAKPGRKTARCPRGRKLSHGACVKKKPRKKAKKSTVHNRGGK